VVEVQPAGRPGITEEVPVTAASAAPVIGPTTPSAVRPLADWKHTTAALVARPKYEVSMPEEPAPETATLHEVMLSVCWRDITEAPVDLYFNTPEYMKAALAVPTESPKTIAATATAPAKNLILLDIGNLLLLIVHTVTNAARQWTAGYDGF
jgi:hypothetical protein